MNLNLKCKTMTEKLIYSVPYGEGTAMLHAHLLVGYNQRTLADYKALAEIMRESFPDARDEEMECAFVKKSAVVQGFTLLIYRVLVAQDSEFPDGWRLCMWGVDGPEYKF